MARSHVRLSTVSDLRDLRIPTPCASKLVLQPVVRGRVRYVPGPHRAARRGALRRTLTQLAIALVLNHPASTAALIGPRTMERLESQLAAAERSSTKLCWTASTRPSRPARP